MIVQPNISPVWHLGVRRVEDLRTLGLRNELVRAYRGVGMNWWRSRILASAEIFAACMGVFAENATSVPKARELHWNQTRRPKKRTYKP